MSDFNRKDHWENIYNTKQLTEVSWYQPSPETSLKLIEEIGASAESELIDIGGGDSFLVDQLLNKGFKHLSVLDVSAKALQRAKNRLGDKAKIVTWIEADISTYRPKKTYDVWHDRAAFHFLTHPAEIAHYKEMVSSFVKPEGYLILGTFSDQGPKKCSGIEITQYSQQDLISLFEDSFECVRTFNEDHQTPFNTTQNFTFGVFKRK